MDTPCPTQIKIRVHRLVFLLIRLAVLPIRCFGEQLSEINLDRGWQRDGWAGYVHHLFD